MLQKFIFIHSQFINYVRLWNTSGTTGYLGVFFVRQSVYKHDDVLCIYTRQQHETSNNTSNINMS